MHSANVANFCTRPKSVAYARLQAAATAHSEHDAEHSNPLLMLQPCYKTVGTTVNNVAGTAVDQIDWWPWIKRGFYVLVAALVLAKLTGGEAFGQAAAAWAQAIGSVAAIAGAAWVSAGEARRAKAADVAETLAFVDAVYAELQVMHGIFLADVMNPLKALANVQKTPMLSLPHPVRQSVFVVYPNNAARVGRIDDEALRTLIVKTYDRAAQILHAMSILHTLTLEHTAATVTVDADEGFMLARSTEALNGKIGYTAWLIKDGEALADNMAVLRRNIDAWKARHN